MPDACSTDDAGRHCTRRTTSRHWEHGTPAAWIEAPRNEKIRLHCTLPADGSEREPGSCRAEVGA